MSLMRSIHRLALIVIVGSGLSPQLAQADDALSGQQAAALRFLHGAIDLHFHMDPPTDIAPGGVIDQVRHARQLGMRGLLFKSHGESTAILAYHLGLEMPDMTLLGGIVLNQPIGGINLAAVERLAALRGHPGRVVWMPTEDSEAQEKMTAQRFPDKRLRPPVVVSKNGELLPAVKEVIAFIGQHDLTLATGHLGAEDALRVLREGRKQGVKHMIATHPMDFGGKMTLDQMQQAAQTGALLEFDFRHLVPAGGAEVIRTLGVEHCFISEFWTYTLPGPPSDTPFKPIEYAGLEAVGRFVDEMHAKGFTDQELDTLVKTNPARVLGLPVE
jgi:Family of unknown function (DUF6282)